MAISACAVIFSFYVQLIAFRGSLSFNLDTKYAVIKEGSPGSYFGFAVAEHQITDGATVEQWILASAPVANNSLIRGSLEAGTVFKCDARNTRRQCDGEVAFDISSSASGENKNHQWFGVSLLSGGRDQFVAACAHRYLHYAFSGQYDLHQGICRSLSGNLRGLRGIRDQYNPCRSILPSNPSHENYGQCLSGIGLDIVKEESPLPFLIGAVGVNNFEGSTFELLATGSSQESNRTGRPLSYFGYSVTHGNYCTINRIDVAMGGPRSNSVGKVVILKRDLSPTKRLTVLTTLPNREDKVELASGFGFALCSYNADPRSPGYTSLIVGAPFHSVDVAESGQVYVYHRASETTMRLLATLSVGLPRANFGSAIVSPGDLNLDGYNDVVIGAPYENDFRGAVYVYMGSATGLATKYTQKVLASTLDSGLRAFGRSLAGGMDLDSNGYNDVVVGAYASDKVVLLRSRPVIKVIPRVETRPAIIVPSLYNRVEDSFQLRFQFRYEERSNRLTSRLRGQLTVQLDPGRSPRMKFQLNDMATITSPVDIATSFRRPARFNIYLIKDENGNFPSYPDVKIIASVKLTYPNTRSPVNGPVVSLNTRPVIDSFSHDVSKQFTQTFGNQFIRLKRDCDPCIPDLAVVSRSNLTIRLGKADVTLNAVIRNIGASTAYQTSLAVTVPNGMSVSYVKLAGDVSKLCTVARALPDGRTESVCRGLFIEINRNSTERISIVLNTKSLTGDLDFKSMMLNVSSENAENATYTNNVFNVALSVVAEADLQLEGNAIPRREFYGGQIVGESKIKKDTEAGHIIKHRYFVINNGPDRIPRAVITIDWPYETASGKHLLYLMDVQSSGANCTFARGQLNELRLQSSGATINFNNTVVRPLQGRRQRRNVPGNGTTPVPATTTTIRPTTNAPQSTTKSPGPQKGVQMEGRVLDCRKGTAKCTRFSCQMNNFQSRGGVQIVVIGRIWNSSLLMDYKSETLSVVSYATVAVGLNASYISDPNRNNNNASIFTVLYSEVPKTVKERVAIWKIILAVLAGIILLALLVFGLYKLGFFKRTNRSRWKKNQRKQAAGEDDDLLDKKVPLDDKN